MNKIKDGSIFQVLSCIVLHTVSEYTAISHDHILLEAWVTHDGSQDREKSKRRKTQDDPTMSLPVLSHMTQGGADQSQLVTTFQQAMASWALVTAHTTLETHQWILGNKTSGPSKHMPTAR